MSCTANQIVDLAISQIGTKEGKNNDNKYGKAYGWNNVAWCVQFIWWLFWYLNSSALFNGGEKTASCSAVYRWAKAAGLLVSWSQARKGDLVLFKFSSSPPDHIGIIEAAGTSRLTTVEGNTSNGNSGSQSNGDGVYRRYRYQSQVYAIIRPKYDAAPASSSTTGGKVEVKIPLIKKGSKGEAVYIWQCYLKEQGYNLGTTGAKKDGCDKDFGDKTKTATIAWQKANGLQQDGEVGEKSWGKAFGV